MSLRLPAKGRFGRAAVAAAALVLCLGLPALGGYLKGREAVRGSLFLPSVPAVSEAAGQRPGMVVGYYPDYARSQGFLPADLAAELLTHIHYAFAGIDEEGRVVLSDPEADQPNLAGLRALREDHPELKILLSVGGWERSGGFSSSAAGEGNRRKFAQSAAELMAEQDLDGVDLDWEFPAAGDRENYTRLMETVRAELDRKGEETGRRYLLSAAVPPGRDLLRAFQPAAMAEAADYLFLMGYDLNGPWDNTVGFNAPLEFPGPGEDDPQRTDSVREGVEAWTEAGAPPEKLVLGMPLYGYRYQLSPGGTGLGGRFLSAGPVSYDRIADQYLPDHRRLFHAAAQAPYLAGEDWFLSYDDPSSIAAKARFAREKGLLGIGFWELSQDREARLIAAGAAAWKNVEISP